MRLATVCMCSVVLVVLGAGMASGQNYPREPIRVLTGAPGSNSNIVARLIAQGITAPLGQPVVVDARGGLISVEVAAKARPDGYTLLLYGSVIWVEPLMRNTDWGGAQAFEPISVATITPNMIVVHPSLPVKSVRELIALAKAKPGQLNYGSASAGATSHLGAELFNAMAGVKIVGVIYRGNALAINDLMGGQIQVSFAGLAETMPYVKAGRLRALAISSLKPSALAPDLPTVTASGLPGYVSDTLLGVMAPAKTPAAIVTRLNEEINRFFATKEGREQFLKLGSEPGGGSPQDFSSTIKAEAEKWGKVIKDAGIKAD